MKKRMISAAMCCVLLTACSGRTEQSSAPTVLSVPAESSVGSSAETSTVSSESSEVTSAPKVETLCKAYALYCVEDDLMLDSYQAEKRIAPASLTKILTASVTLRYLKPDDVVTVGSELSMVNEGSSLCYIAPGQRLTVETLMYGLLLPSGNDAAYTAAVCTARKASGDPYMSDAQAVGYFCGMMNDMARELGMTGSHFADPDGWDDPEHYTTVSDLIKAAKYALTVPEISKIVATPRKEVVFETGETAKWFNGNKLLHDSNKFFCKDAIGMKNGATDDAGLCLIAVFRKNGKTYIDIVVGSEEDEDRYNKILQLYDEIP